MKVLRVMPGEKPSVAELENSLEAMQEFVGGTIEAVYPFDDPVAIICNDEGKLLGLPPNRALRHPETGGIYDILCGPFFLCGLDEDSFASLSQEYIEKYSRLFAFPETFLRLGASIVAIPYETGDEYAKEE